jgi:hypothetical protein
MARIDDPARQGMELVGEMILLSARVHTDWRAGRGSMVREAQKHPMVDTSYTLKDAINKIWQPIWSSTINVSSLLTTPYSVLQQVQPHPDIRHVGSCSCLVKDPEPPSPSVLDMKSVALSIASD